MELIAMIVAVLIGYVLGVTPFAVYFLWQNGIFEKKQEEPYITETEKNFYNEWLYGKQEDENQTNQQKIYKEYVTGEESK